MLSGCNDVKPSDSGYRELKGYFVRNDVFDGILTEKITSQEKFDRYFGAAATQSQQPEPIDFSKEYVMAVILSNTDHATVILVDSLVHSGNKARLYYSVQTDGPQSYTIRPVLLLGIERRYGNIEVTDNGAGTKSSFVQLDLKDGGATATVKKNNDERVTFTFEPNNYTRLSGTLTSADPSANVRFSQIILPDGSADGPFGREITYGLPQKGAYDLIVHENMMAGDPWAGEFTVRIELGQ